MYTKEDLLKSWNDLVNFITGKKGEIVKTSFFRTMALYIMIYEEIANDIIKYLAKYKNDIEEIIKFSFVILNTNPEFQKDLEEVKEKYSKFFKKINDISIEASEELIEVYDEEGTIKDPFKDLKKKKTH